MLRASFSTSAGIVAENSSVCRFAGQKGDNLAHVVDEAHVQHAVGLVQDEDLNIAPG